MGDWQVIKSLPKQKKGRDLFRLADSTAERMITAAGTWYRYAVYQGALAVIQDIYFKPNGRRNRCAMMMNL